MIMSLPLNVFVKVRRFVADHKSPPGHLGSPPQFLQAAFCADGGHKSFYAVSERIYVDFPDYTIPRRGQRVEG